LAEGSHRALILLWGYPSRLVASASSFPGLPPSIPSYSASTWESSTSHLCASSGQVVFHGTNRPIPENIWGWLPWIHFSLHLQRLFWYLLIPYPLSCFTESWPCSQFQD
jgi:hypothetical protein